jgi:Ca2+-binding EF-hand superfamily protein
VFALTAFTPVITHALADGKCGVGMMKYEMVDANKDDKISKQEMMTQLQEMFEAMDQDESGSISQTEWLFIGYPEAQSR